MKKLKFFTPLFIIFLVFTACQKENTLDDQVILDEQVILDNQEGEAVLRKKKHPVPFSGSFISTMIPYPPVPNEAICGIGTPEPIWHITQTLSGNATHMGNISGDISSCIDLNTFTLFDGFTTLVAANGDSLFIVGSEYPFLIEGGSGRFDDATGSVDIIYDEIDPPSGVFDSYFDGEIQY